MGVHGESFHIDEGTGEIRGDRQGRDNDLRPAGTVLRVGFILTEVGTLACKVRWPGGQLQ